jgi:hypothetical protein
MTGGKIVIMYTGAEERQFSNTENGHKRGKVMIVIAMHGKGN